MEQNIQNVNILIELAEDFFFLDKPIGASPGRDYVLTRMVLQIILYSKW